MAKITDASYDPEEDAGDAAAEVIRDGEDTAKLEILIKRITV